MSGKNFHPCLLQEERVDIVFEIIIYISSKMCIQCGNSTVTGLFLYFFQSVSWLLTRYGSLLKYDRMHIKFPTSLLVGLSCCMPHALPKTCVLYLCLIMYKCCRNDRKVWDKFVISRFEISLQLILICFFTLWCKPIHIWKSSAVDHFCYSTKHARQFQLHYWVFN